MSTSILPQRADAAGGTMASNRHPSIIQSLVDDVRLVLVANRPRLEGEFDAHVAEAIAMMRSVRAVLIVEVQDGANLDAGERQKLLRAGLFEPPVAVLTDSRIARFIMTAVRWLGVSKVRTFSTNQAVEACEFLGVPVQVRPRLFAEIRTMTERVLEAARAPSRSPRP